MNDRTQAIIAAIVSAIIAFGLTGYALISSQSDANTQDVQNGQQP